MCLYSFSALCFALGPVLVALAGWGWLLDDRPAAAATVAFHWRRARCCDAWAHADGTLISGGAAFFRHMHDTRTVGHTLPARHALSVVRPVWSYHSGALQ
jgi:hypothetical protein